MGWGRVGCGSGSFSPRAQAQAQARMSEASLAVGPEGLRPASLVSCGLAEVRGRGREARWGVGRERGNAGMEGNVPDLQRQGRPRARPIEPGKGEEGRGLGVRGGEEEVVVVVE